MKPVIRFMKLSFVLMVLLQLTFQLKAQPTGGPYGPVSQNYDLPKANTIYFVAPNGDPSATGTNLEQPTTLENAITKVVSGDAIVLRGGTYRTGSLYFNQGITLQPYQDEKPILKGTRVATQGRKLSGAEIWRISWETLFPSAPLQWWFKDSNVLSTPMHRFNNDMVFVDGNMLQSAAWEGDVNKNTYYIDYENKQVYVGFDPAEHVVEITAHDGALIRTSAEVHGKISDKKGPVIRGITFTQYAWRAIEIEGKRRFTAMDEPTDEPIGLSDPSTYGKEAVGTIIENITITHCSRVAGYFRGDSLTIRNSLFSDTGTEGVYVIGSCDVLLEGNIIRRNNIENITGYYASAVKIFNQSHRVTCRNNLVLDSPTSSGIWYDVGNKDGVFINNWVQNCSNGFFFEISLGAICVNNVFVNCDNGIFVLNSSNVRAWQNTLINCSAAFKRDMRQAGGTFGWHAATGPDRDKREGHVFANNLIVVDETHNDALLKVEQASQLCGVLTTSPLVMVDGNTYIHQNNEVPIINWSPSDVDGCESKFDKLHDFQQQFPEFEASGVELINDPRSVFKGFDLGHYQLKDNIAEQSVTIPLSDEIKQLIKKKKTKTAGAY